MSSTSSPSYARSRPLLADRKPTSTAELRIDLAYLSSDLKYSNALPLRLRAACVSHALHPTDEFDAPSVRKDTQPKNTRVQPPQGVPTFYLANVEPARLDACVCVRAWFKMRGSKCRSRARVLRACFTSTQHTNRDQIHGSDFTQDRYRK
jgi:hypothetical protein